MRVFFAYLALSSAVGVLCNPLLRRQTQNTNNEISAIVDALDMQAHVNVPNIGGFGQYIGTQVDQLVAAFKTAASDLSNTTVSSGSNTTSPTDDDISVTFSDVMQILATGFSGISTSTVPSFGSMISDLDPVVAASAMALNTTLPGSLVLVHDMMLDAQQFFIKEGGWTQTLQSLGF
ncbi:hypothetical protein BDQ17DRAFT_1359365 [Cyathus striatus]|nr:hypothetical protein BDQ17DRAFT_1359365 [Cyathus striatus]